MEASRSCPKNVSCNILTIARMPAKIILDALIYLNDKELLNVRK